MSRADNHSNSPLRKRKPIERSQAVRVLLFASAISAVLSATYFSWSDTYSGVIQTASVAFFVAVGVVSLVSGLLFPRPGRVLRWTIIGFEILLVPLQLATSIRSNVPLIGVVLSVAILVLLRPAFPRLSRNSRRFFLTLHVGLAVSWLGASMSMVVLSLTGLLTEDLELRHNA